MVEGDCANLYHTLDNGRIYKAEEPQMVTFALVRCQGMTQSSFLLLLFLFGGRVFFWGVWGLGFEVLFVCLGRVFLCFIPPPLPLSQPPPLSLSHTHTKPRAAT